MDTEKKLIQVADVSFGGDELVMIVGPCAVEDEQQLMTIAQKIKSLGIRIIRASLFKPRTSPKSFQGLGLDGIPILRRVKQETDLLIESEIMDVRKLDILSEHVDILRVGTRNMQNYDLLKEIGKIDKPVILKRGFGSTIKEFICAAEYIFAGGNDKLVLCERGIRTFETAYRFTLDLAAVDILKRETPFPILVDPSHAAGNRELVFALSRAAVAAGADGLMIEMHPNPENALCDGSQSLYLHQIESLIDEVNAIKKTLNLNKHSENVK